MPVPDIAAYHDARYAPGNLVVAAAGNVEHDRIVELVEGALGQAEAGGRAHRAPSPRRTSSAARLASTRRRPSSTTSASAGRACSRSDERRFALRVLDTILGGSTSSRLFQEVREKRGLAYSVYSYSSQYVDSGQVGLYVGTRPGQRGRGDGGDRRASCARCARRA